MTATSWLPDAGAGMLVAMMWSSILTDLARHAMALLACLIGLPFERLVFSANADESAMLKAMQYVRETRIMSEKTVVDGTLGGTPDGWVICWGYMATVSVIDSDRGLTHEVLVTWPRWRRKPDVFVGVAWRGAASLPPGHVLLSRLQLSNGWRESWVAPQYPTLFNPDACPPASHRLAAALQEALGERESGNMVAYVSSPPGAGKTSAIRLLAHRLDAHLIDTFNWKADALSKVMTDAAGRRVVLDLSEYDQKIEAIVRGTWDEKRNAYKRSVADAGDNNKEMVVVTPENIPVFFDRVHQMPGLIVVLAVNTPYADLVKKLQDTKYLRGGRVDCVFEVARGGDVRRVSTDVEVSSSADASTPTTLTTRSELGSEDESESDYVRDVRNVRDAGV